MSEYDELDCAISQYYFELSYNRNINESMKDRLIDIYEKLSISGLIKLAENRSNVVIPIIVSLIYRGIYFKMHQVILDIIIKDVPSILLRYLIRFNEPLTVNYSTFAHIMAYYVGYDPLQKYKYFMEFKIKDIGKFVSSNIKHLPGYKKEHLEDYRKYMLTYSSKLFDRMMPCYLVGDKTDICKMICKADTILKIKLRITYSAYHDEIIYYNNDKLTFDMLKLLKYTLYGGIHDGSYFHIPQNILDTLPIQKFTNLYTKVPVLFVEYSGSLEMNGGEGIIILNNPGQFKYLLDFKQIRVCLPVLKHIPSGKGKTNEQLGVIAWKYNIISLFKYHDSLLILSRNYNTHIRKGLHFDDRYDWLNYII